MGAAAADAAAAAAAAAVNRNLSIYWMAPSVKTAHLPGPPHPSHPIHRNTKTKNFYTFYACCYSFKFECHNALDSKRIWSFQNF